MDKFKNKGFTILLVLCFINVMFLLTNQIVRDVVLQKGIILMTKKRMLKSILVKRILYDDILTTNKFESVTSSKQLSFKNKNFKIKAKQIGFLKDNLLNKCKTGVRVFKITFACKKSNFVKVFVVALR